MFRISSVHPYIPTVFSAQILEKLILGLQQLDQQARARLRQRGHRARPHALGGRLLAAAAVGHLWGPARPRLQGRARPRLRGQARPRLPQTVAPQASMKLPRFMMGLISLLFCQRRQQLMHQFNILVHQQTRATTSTTMRTSAPRVGTY